MSNQDGVATESQPLISKKKTDVEAGHGDVTKPTTTSATIFEDVMDILKLAVPIFITSLSWVGVSSNQEDEHFQMYRIDGNKDFFLTSCFPLSVLQIPNQNERIDTASRRCRKKPRTLRF